MAYETTNASGVGTTRQVVVGLFNDANDAHQAVTQLRASGFNAGQIGAAFRHRPIDLDANRSKVSAGSMGRSGENWWDKVKDAFRSDDAVEERREVAADSTLGSDANPQDDDEYDFAGDDFENSIAGTGIPSDRAAYLSRRLKSGGAIVTVSDANRADEAEQILVANNASVRYEAIAGTGVAGMNSTGTEVVGPVAAASTGREVTDTEYADQRKEGASADAMDRVQLFGEVLRVHKERINRGEVRVRKDVITEHQTIEVPVTREELVLDRVAVSGDTPASSADIGRSQEIRIPLSEETVRVEKQAVVREEVTVGKRAVSEVATVSDDVRHEELRVDSNGETPKRAAIGEEPTDDIRRHG